MMTHSVFRRRTAVIGVLAMAVTACPATTPSSGDPRDDSVPDDLLLESVLQAHEHEAPLFGRFSDLNGERTICNATPSDVAFPDRPELVWKVVRAYELSAASYADPSIAVAGVPYVIVADGDVNLKAPGEPGDDAAVYVAPWAGDVELECGGTPSAGALVITASLQVPVDLPELTIDEFRDLASTRVDQAGLQEVPATFFTSECECTESDCPPCTDQTPPID